MSAVPLFDAFPETQRKLPHAAFASLPTPVERLDALSEQTGVNCFVKRDDLSSPLYGGNKVRKLEFFMGRALHDGIKSVLTFGAAGSNHALATAIYARQIGLHCISMLLPQPPALSVRKNLLYALHVGAELHYYPSRTRQRLGVAYHMQRCLLRDKRYPQVIPPGGSSPIGALGFVNAAFELQQQIAAGVLPAPDLIFTACGTMGTAVGLLLGLKAAGLSAKVVAVRVTDPAYASMQKAQELFGATNALLHTADPRFPLLPLRTTDFLLQDDYMGPGYGIVTEKTDQAIAHARTMGLKLEGTYTGKAFAAFLDTANHAAQRGKTVLYWNTYNSHDFSDIIAKVEYHALPPALYPYFETEVS